MSNEARCGDKAYCLDCAQVLTCAREPLHKGFHMETRTHRWDEYGDVSHD